MVLRRSRAVTFSSLLIRDRASLKAICTVSGIPWRKAGCTRCKCPRNSTRSSSACLAVKTLSDGNEKGTFFLKVALLLYRSHQKNSTTKAYIMKTRIITAIPLLRLPLLKRVPTNTIVSKRPAIFNTRATGKGISKANTLTGPRATFKTKKIQKRIVKNKDLVFLFIQYYFLYKQGLLRAAISL